MARSTQLTEQFKNITHWQRGLKHSLFLNTSRLRKDSERVQREVREVEDQLDSAARKIQGLYSDAIGKAATEEIRCAEA